MNDNRIKPLSPVALVTGAGRRIGAAIVKMLHEQGYCVIIHCLNQIKADSAMTLAADLRDAQAIQSLINAALALPWQFNFFYM